MGGLSHLGDLMFCQKKLCMRCEAWADALFWWSCQSAVARSCGLLNHWNSFHRRMFKLNANSRQIHSSIRSVILNTTATQYIWSLNSVYRPCWLVQWSHHCSCMCLPVHSPLLWGYINVAQTILVMLTLAGLFPHRSCTSSVYCIVCSQPQVKSPFIIIYPPFTLFFLTPTSLLL